MYPKRNRPLSFPETSLLQGRSISFPQPNATIGQEWRASPTESPLTPHFPSVTRYPTRSEPWGVGGYEGWILDRVKLTATNLKETPPLSHPKFHGSIPTNEITSAQNEVKNIMVWVVSPFIPQWRHGELSGGNPAASRISGISFRQSDL